MQTLSSKSPYALSARRSKPWGALLVLLLHLLVLGLLMSARLKSPKPLAAQGLVQLRLIPWLAESASKQERTVASKKAEPTAMPRSLPMPLPSRSSLSPALSPSRQAEGEQSTAASKPTANTNISAPKSLAEAPAPAASSPLNLALPSASLDRAPALAALRDPRSNTHRPDFGERMAIALGSDPSLREEIIAPGHRRFRKGSSCFDVQDSRDSQINPFDERTRGNKLISPCKK
ncbi:hypothetical protein [Paucibacter sp. Y2R2-4]|uniref:hypothetical protein n=1 Tax=Paucibacter sp. Y2R2-4 TaxID=2893553 RepID=UPI0021E40283|nr:hypothetical protein [Paucibacter sp. Y2R2-4]MCV2349135.1 hypothetical protein [Paucibacter sp. Y2R2-4]